MLSTLQILLIDKQPTIYFSPQHKLQLVYLLISSLHTQYVLKFWAEGTQEGCIFNDSPNEEDRWWEETGVSQVYKDTRKIVEKHRSLFSS